MANPPISVNTSKAVNTTPQIPSPLQSQSSSLLRNDYYPQRQGGGSGNFGASLASRTTLSASRNNQSFRRQHRGQRKPKLVDEDAAAESVNFRICFGSFMIGEKLTMLIDRPQCSPLIVGKDGLR